MTDTKFHLKPIRMPDSQVRCSFILKSSSYSGGLEICFDPYRAVKLTNQELLGNLIMYGLGLLVRVSAWGYRYSKTQKGLS